MNIPLGPSFGNFKLRSEKNRERDQKSLIDAREEFVAGGNPCLFPSKVYVINKLDREDRWEGFKRINSDLFEFFEVERWEATSPGGAIKDVVDAIFDSFYRCIKNSSEECLIIMEDDAYLTKGALEKIQKSWEELPPDWDVLVGNHYFFGEMKILSDSLAKPVDRASTANFVIVRKTILQKMEQHLHLRDSPSIRDFDHYITSSQVPINNFTIWPMVSREIASFSDHKGKKLDSSCKIREHAFKYLFIDQDSYYPSLEGW